jgi:hydrogenase maturation protease
MQIIPARCLVLACGNTLREDDGVGPWLARWAEGRFQGESAVRVVSRQQWTPELAEDVAHAESVIFIDCAANAASGSLRLAPVAPGGESPGIATHHFGASELLSLSKALYGAVPRISLLLTIGAGSLELREGFSNAVNAALPEAQILLEKSILELLGRSRQSYCDEPSMRNTL